MTSADMADLLQTAGICLWVGASLGGFGLLRLGNGRGLGAFLRAELLVQGVASLVLGGLLLVPGLREKESVDPDAKAKVEFPNYNLLPWRALVTLHDGRKKPFETVAIESLRAITGRSTYKGQDATAIVLQWMMLNGRGLDGNREAWEKEPFILCPDGDLRELIYRDLLGPDAVLTEEHRRGKFVSPHEVRRSPAFFQLTVKAREKSMEDSEKASQHFSPAERKAREVSQRIDLFDEISQGDPVTFGHYSHRPGPDAKLPDPIGLVALDRRGGGWFTIGQLLRLKKEDDRNRALVERAVVEPILFPFSGLTPELGIAESIAKVGLGFDRAAELQQRSRWRENMRDRLSRVPQLYISPERTQALEEFQSQIKSGTAQKALDELAVELKRRREDASEVELFGDVRAFATDEERAKIGKRMQESQKTGDYSAVEREMRAVLQRRHDEILADLQRRVASAKSAKYHPDDDRFRMLHLNYLESRYPNIYIESSAWQPYPPDDVNRVLESHAATQQAYQTGDAVVFAAASQTFFDTVREVSAKYDTANGYPGVTTAALEMQLNRVRPFMWAWILMLGCITLLIAGMIAAKFEFAAGGKLFYVLGWMTYLASLGFQVFGFYARVAISGRPPVSNMYETIIWVAAMSALFAVILELKFRRTLILLSGAFAACLALVLADQLPHVQGLESNIKPLVPVLRTNYWLIIHVLTIVASYAGGALAWVLGNIALGMIAFGNPQRETIKTLAQFSYRGMQIAVLLLAAGTFLGGWWAAESWGRFWGWDAKEVWALISLVCYVIPLHARYVGWVKDFGLAVSAVLCFAAIMMSWYGVNFVLSAGLHAYGFGGGGPWWVAWVATMNLVYVITCCLVHVRRTKATDALRMSVA